MKIIYKYIIKRFIGPFVLTFFFAIFILLMQYLWKYVDDLVGKGLEITIILELLFYASATFVATAAPLAILLSSLMTFGNLGERYEIVAIKSAGIPISKLFIPLLLLSFIIGCATFWFANNVSPKAFLKSRTLLLDIRDTKPALSIEEGVFYDGLDNYVIRIGKKGRDNASIEDVIIYDHSKGQGNTTVTYAKKGEMNITADKKYMLFTLYDGFYWDESRNSTNSGTSKSKYPLIRAIFKKQYKRFDISSFQFQKTDQSFYQSNNQSLPISELSIKIDTLKKQINMMEEAPSVNFFSNLYFYNNIINIDENFKGTSHFPVYYTFDSLPLQKKIEVMNFAQMGAGGFINAVRFAYDDIQWRNYSLWSFQIEVHRKFTLAVACLLFFFIGAPLGSIIRKGGIAIPLVVTVLFFIFYFVISIIGEKIAKGDLIPVYMGMWFSTAVLLPICAFLSYKATIDSSVLSIEEISKWFTKLNIFRFFKSKKS
ncbi:MAG TPA: LptF/LptG family permease [Bacteroidales bacterium]|nr:LptF/LptG family permease [Bacteroidales bacterium]HPS70666.1 LptF/LptG family permease [Bacteroidales bacterium]